MWVATSERHKFRRSCRWPKRLRRATWSCATQQRWKTVMKLMKHWWFCRPTWLKGKRNGTLWIERIVRCSSSVLPAVQIMKEHGLNMMNRSLYKDRQIYSMIFNNNLIFFIWQRSLWNLVTSFKTSRRPEHTSYYQLVTANPWDPGPSNSYQWGSPGWCCHCCPASGRWNPRLEWNMPHLKPGPFHRFSNSASIPSVSGWEPRCTRTKIFWRYLVSGSACCWVSLRCWVCLNLRPVGDLPELWMKGTFFFTANPKAFFNFKSHLLLDLSIFVPMSWFFHVL